MIKNLLFTGFLLTFCSFNLISQSASQWRGYERSGHYPDQNLFDSWGENGPDLLLHVDDLPESYSSVVAVNGIIYTSGIRDDQEILTALDHDGKIIWETVYGDAWGKSFPPARCTPTIEGAYAYCISGSGDIACLNLENGELVWSMDGYKIFGGRWGNWGVAESPLIIDDKLIYTPCGDQTTMVALDKSNGNLIWKSASIGDQSAYVSPVLAVFDDLKLVITVTGNYALGVNADNGEIYWKFEYSSVEKPSMGEDINPVTPLVKGNEVFITSGYNHVGVMLEMINDYRDVKLKWISRDMDVHHGGVVEVDGYIYGSNYTNIRNGNWLCISWESGEVLYDHKWNPKGQIIYSDGKLICYDERKGNIALVKANPNKFDLLSEFKMPFGNGPHWSHPSIFDNVMYLRHGKSLVAYRIGE